MKATQKIRKVVIPCAGIGSRFLPASKVVPKELFTIVDRPVLQHNVDEAIAAGIEELILVVSPRKKELARYFATDPELEALLGADGKTEILEALRSSQPNVTITTVIQEEPKGLGHAVWTARDAVGDEPFAVLLPDDLILSKVPCLQQMFAGWKEHQLGCVAVRTVPAEQVHRYGIVSLEQKDGRFNRMKAVVEKPSAAEAPSRLAIIGRYILPHHIFAILEKLPTGTIGEIQLTDALQILAEQEGLLAYEFEGDHYDAGNPQGFVAANLAYAWEREELRSDLESLMKRLLS